MKTIRNQYSNFRFHYEVFSKNTKNAPILKFFSHKTNTFSYDENVQMDECYELINEFQIFKIKYFLDKKTS